MKNKIQEKSTDNCAKGMSVVPWIKRILKRIFLKGQTEKIPEKTMAKSKDIHDIDLDQRFGPEGGEGEQWEHKGLWRR